MPPLLALTLSLGLSGVLLYRESRLHQNVSAAIWIPVIWLFILGSRPISVWFSFNGPGGLDAMMEGSPVDRIVYLILMLAGLVVILYRRLSWKELFSSNLLLVCFIAYCAMSVAWSDFPFIAFKRWFKSLGDPLMALIILSEAAPAAAFGTVLRRCAFVLVPLSIVFIKYFPVLGRGYDDWSGAAFYTGVTTNKNMLGYLLLVFGLWFLCTVFTKSKETDRLARRTELAVSVLFIGMILWLVKMANSQTSVIALAVASAVVVSLGSPKVRKYLGGVALASVAVFLTLQWAFDISGLVLAGIGRDATLTGRTDIWAAVLKLSQSAFVGSGFQSFWLGSRLEQMWAKFPVFRPNQAHNGYLEIYLNLGWIGLLLFVGVLIAFYRTMREKLERAIVLDDPAELALAKFSFGYFAAYLLYNVTEAIFQPLNFLFIVFLALGIRYQIQQAAVREARPEPARVPAEALSRNVLQWQPPERSRDPKPAPWAARGQSAQASGGSQGVRGSQQAGSAGKGPWAPRRTDLWSPPSPRRGDKFSS
jgi:exopolysaccharide production protein ExoQ